MTSLYEMLQQVTHILQINDKDLNLSATDMPQRMTYRVSE